MKNINIKSEELLNLFLDLVRIDSESGEEDQVRGFIKSKLDALNIETIVDGYGNLIARLDGLGEPLMLSTHMDTVKPGKGIKPIVNGSIITSSGNTILGADDKSGIAGVVYALLELKKSGIAHRAIEAVFTREEETGTYGAKNLDYNLIKSKQALVLDHTARPGKIVLGAPFLTDIEITITGKAAHASKPETGINSIAVAARAISRLKVGRIDKETTNNFGIINGGVISNGVPEQVVVKAEARSHNEVKLDKQIHLIKKSFEEAAVKFNAKVEFVINEKSLGYGVDKTGEFYKSVQSTWKKLNVVTFSEKIGGASDANVFNQKGIVAIPLGSGGQHCHTTNESVYIEEIEDLARFLLTYSQLLPKTD